MRAHYVAAVLLSAGLAASDGVLSSAFRDIPAERNAWPLMVEAAELVTRDDAQPVGSNYPDPWAPLRPAIARRLADNAPALARLDSALRRPEMVWPARFAEPEQEDATYRLTAKWRELARLKTQRAYARQATGDRLGALADIDDLLTWVELAQDGGGSVRQYTSFGAVRAVALNSTRWLLDTPLPLTEAERRAWQALSLRIADESRAVPALRRAYAGELAQLDHTLHQPSYYPGPMPSETDIQQVLAWYRALYDAAARAAEQLPWQRDGSEFASVRQPAIVRNDPVWRATGIDDGPVLVNRLVETDRADRRLTVAAIAVRLYQADHGSLPRDLRQVAAAGLLPAEPIDPFDNRPLRYLPDRGLLYSVGRDRTDNGGDLRCDQVARLIYISRPPEPEPLPVTRSRPGLPPPPDDSKGGAEPSHDRRSHGESALF